MAKKELHPSGTDMEIMAAYQAKDAEYWKDMETAVATAGLSWSDAMKHASAFVRRRDLATILARYELFKMVVDVPGSIVELGVQYGSGLFLWSKLLETFCPGDRLRMVYGFEHFQGLSTFSEEDGGTADWSDKHVGGLTADAALVRALVELHNRDNFLSGIARCRLVEGDICETVDRFVRDNPGLRISLLYLDCDLYEPTLAALRALYPLVVKGGVVVLDEYAQPPWEGESKAFEEYFPDIETRPVCRTFSFSRNPTGYFVK